MKYKKIFIISLLLIAILAIGAASASEDISDDAIAAIEPTDEVIVDSVDDEQLESQVEYNAISEGDKSGDVLSASDFNVYFYNISKEYDDAVRIESNCNKNGKINVYINDEETPRATYNLSEGNFKEQAIGSFYAISNIKSVRPKTLNLEYGNTNIKVKFLEDYGTETLIGEGTVQYSFIDLIFPSRQEINLFNDLFVNLTLPNNATGTLTYFINDEPMGPINYNEGKANIEISKSHLILGNNTIVLNYNEVNEGNYFNINVSRTIPVGPKIILPEVVSTIEKFNITVEFPQDYTGSFIVYNTTQKMSIFGSIGKMTVEKDEIIGSCEIINGIATVEISNASIPNSNYILVYDTDKVKDEQIIYINVIWNDEKISATVTPDTIKKGESLKINFSSLNDYSTETKLSIIIDGEEEIITNTTNITKVINGLTVGTHAINVRFYGNEHYYYSNTFYVNVEPNHVATQISAPKVTATYSVAKNLVITLKDANGNTLKNKEVTVKVGTISKTLKTNSKGQISLAVSSLVPKTYTATFKFAGDSDYAASSGSAKVVVAKAAPKLTAAKKTFKVKAKTKKVTAKLVNNKGKVMKKVKLTLKIGKKTYTATTNSKGVATFKVKLSKKGKYTGTVKFAGSKYFKAATKKIKITVKK